MWVVLLLVALDCPGADHGLGSGDEHRNIGAGTNLSGLNYNQRG